MYAQLNLTLFGYTVCRPPGSSVHGFPRQEYWSGLLFPVLGAILNPGIQPVSPASSSLAGGFCTIVSPGKPRLCRLLQNMCIAFCQIVRGGGWVVTTVLSTETDHNLPSSFSLESYRTLIDSRIIEESDREIRKYRETSENRNMMYQNQWDAAKVVLRGKCIAIYMAMAPDSSTLAWKIPRTEEPGRLQSMGLLRVGHD